RVRILDFGPRRKTFHADIFARGIRALHEVRFARDRNSVRIISLCNLCRSSGGRGRSGCGLNWGRSRGRRWSIRIEGLVPGGGFVGVVRGVIWRAIGGGGRGWGVGG